jgi:hypothetical protein
MHALCEIIALISCHVLFLFCLKRLKCKLTNAHACTNQNDAALAWANSYDVAGKKFIVEVVDAIGDVKVLGECAAMSTSRM